MCIQAGERRAVVDDHGLIAEPLDLEAARRESEPGDVHEVVAVVRGEGDGVPSVGIGARATRYVAAQRRHRDGRAFDWRAVGPDDATANEICLRAHLRQRSQREYETKQTTGNSHETIRSEFVCRKARFSRDRQCQNAIKVGLITDRHGHRRTVTDTLSEFTFGTIMTSDSKRLCVPFRLCRYCP